MPVPPLRDFADVRKAINTTNTQVSAVAAKLERLSQAKDAKDEDIAKNLVDFGVRLGRITEHVSGTEDISQVAHGFARLVNISDYSTDDKIVAAYNITEKEYTVGTLVALLPVQGSFFVASDPGIFPATILPLVDLTLPPGDTFLELVVGTDTDLSTAAPQFITVSDALDGVDAAADEYRLEIECINGALQFDPGDSDVTVDVVNASDIFLFGTLNALNNFFAGSTTGFLNINPAVPGADTIHCTLKRTVDSRAGTYSIGMLANQPDAVTADAAFGLDEEIVIADGTTRKVKASGQTIADVIAAASGGAVTTYDVQIFYYTGSGQTWTKPANAVTVRRYLIGGGGGGGGGRRGTSSSIRGGGGGGGGGGYSFDSNDESKFGATETVTVGAGGSQGARASASDTNGGTGGTGGNTSMTATGTGGATLTANGGAGGAGGTNSGGASGGTGGTGSGGENGENGGTGGGAGTGSVGGSSTSKMNGAGGGGGWGQTAGAVNDAGGYGGDSGGLGGQWSNGVGNAATDNMGLDGHPGGQFFLPDGTPKSFGGGGGGGAFSCTLTTGVINGTGGRGNLFGAGGGGGGGNTNGGNGFNMGEVGAPGIAIIVTTCEA